VSVDYANPRPVSQVRLLIADTAQPVLLEDDKLLGFLAIEGQSVKRAAAAALEAIATSEVLVSKVIRTQDLQTDGSKVAAELRARALQLRAQADNDDDLADGGFIDVIAYDPYGLTVPEATEYGVAGLL
jgi:hypothetical protein